MFRRGVGRSNMIWCSFLKAGLPAQVCAWQLRPDSQIWSTSRFRGAHRLRVPVVLRFLSGRKKSKKSLL